MTTVETAISLAEEGLHIFPVYHTDENEKKPLTPEGHLNATRDPGLIEEWWEKWPFAKVGVACGPSGIVVADIDTKNGKDGWDSLDKEWLDIPTTFSYETGTGGSHLVYADPGTVRLNGLRDYRGMEGVDRRGGSSWVMWTGPVPEKGSFAPAPDWLLDEAKERAIQGFEGSIQDWYDKLVPGEPNVMVRRAINAINDDMGHSDMVSATYEAIRLGAEGATGVPELIDALEEAWMNRPAENHTTPESAWKYKFQEALLGGIEKYGETTDLLKNLPAYNIGMVPSSISDTLVGTPGGKAEFSRLLGELIKETEDDNRILSILWNSAATKDLSREWGLEFTFKRIQDARIKPEPTRENPRIEEQRQAELQGKPDNRKLLTDEEREYIAKRPTFVNHVEEIASRLGYDQLPYFRSIAWVTAAMAFSFKGFIPLSKTHKMGLNLWFINLGESGTGKSISGHFRDDILRTVFEGDNEGGTQYDLGDDSSPQGLHLALLERDRLPALFASDEAAGFFSTLGLRDWKTGIDEKITSWYNGYVQGTQKMTLKEMRGKTAMTSFNMHMFGTPGKVTKVVETEMFETGFMARVNWVIGNPPRSDDSRFQLRIDDDNESIDFDVLADEVMGLGIDLMTAISHRDKPAALLPAPGVMERLSEAYKDMYQLAEHKPNWELIEPSITRLSETMMKCAGICALYREDEVITMADALHAINAVEEWYENLFIVTGMISSGEFQRRCDELEAFLRQEGGKASGSKVFHRFRNWVVRDSKEIENVVTYLTQSGILNKLEANGGVQYELNG